MNASDYSFEIYDVREKLLSVEQDILALTQRDDLSRDQTQHCNEMKERLEALLTIV